MMKYLKLIQSVLAGMIGIQKKSRLIEDFEQSSPIPFIITGIIFATLFVISIVVAVRIILS